MFKINETSFCYQNKLLRCGVDNETARQKLPSYQNKGNQVVGRNEQRTRHCHCPFPSAVERLTRKFVLKEKELFFSVVTTWNAMELFDRAVFGERVWADMVRADPVSFCVRGSICVCQNVYADTERRRLSYLALWHQKIIIVVMEWIVLCVKVLTPCTTGCGCI